MFGDDGDTPDKTPLQRFGGPALVGVFVVGGAIAIMALLTHKVPVTKPYREPPHITTVNLPPPPPPPPPLKKIEEKPTERPKAEKIQQPKPTPRAPTPPQALTANTGPGTDAFGLRGGDGSGGGDCVGDCGSGDGSDAGPYYENVVKGLVDEAVRGDDRLRRARYRATVSFVIDRAGHVENVQFQNFDGDADTRAEVIRALSHIAASESIPSDMTNGKPWVVRLYAHAPG